MQIGKRSNILLQFMENLTAPLRRESECTTHPIPKVFKKATEQVFLFQAVSPRLALPGLVMLVRLLGLLLLRNSSSALSVFKLRPNTVKDIPPVYNNSLVARVTVKIVSAADKRTKLVSSD